MSKRITSACMLAVLLAFTACRLPKRPSELWFFTYYSGENTVTDTALTPANFLYLQQDGSYTCNFGKFDYGKWENKNDKLFLVNTNNDTAIFPIEGQTSEDLRLIVNKGITANFEASDFSASSAINDPFSLANNQWRIPATHKETEQELRQRLQNHCMFWMAYFTWALENKAEQVDVRSTATPIKIYGNGFSLKPYSDLPAEWRSCFYDTEDCKIANNLIYEVMQFHDIAWPHTSDKYKMFIGAFQQLKGYLK